MLKKLFVGLVVLSLIPLAGLPAFAAEGKKVTLLKVSSSANTAREGENPNAAASSRNVMNDFKCMGTPSFRFRLQLKYSISGPQSKSKNIGKNTH